MFHTYESSDILYILQLIKLLYLNLYLTCITGNKAQTTNKYDVTLMTQLSADRLPMMQQMLTMWHGPVNAVIHGTDYEIKKMERVVHAMLGNRTNVAIHVVYKRLVGS